MYTKLLQIKNILDHEGERLNEWFSTPSQPRRSYWADHVGDTKD